MRVFISQKMHGISESEAMQIREESIQYLKTKYGNNIEVVDNYHHSDIPDNAGRLWFLGSSIRLLDTCDAIYFHPSANKSYGGLVEMYIAKLYNLTILK